MNEELQKIRDDLLSLEDWEERYRYLIDMGKSLPPMPLGGQVAANRLHDCTSQVWLITSLSEDGKCLHISGDSNAMIVKGLLALVVAMFSDQTLEHIVSFDHAAFLASLELTEYLTARRTNAFIAIIKRIKVDAASAIEARKP